MFSLAHSVRAQVWIGEWADASATATAAVASFEAERTACNGTRACDLQLVWPTQLHSVYYVGIYGAISLAAISIYLWRNFQWATTVVTAASHLHHNLLMNVLRLPTSFFDSVPTGRVLNRFASDIDMIDTTLSSVLQQPVELLIKGISE
jgi:ABC-type multidrug transport system fused ATPase/permease subunit